MVKITELKQYFQSDFVTRTVHGNSNPFITIIYIAECYQLFVLNERTVSWSHPAAVGSVVSPASSRSV